MSIVLGQDGFPRAMQSKADLLVQPSLDPHSSAARSSRLEDGWVWGEGHWVLLLSEKYQTSSLQLELTHFDLEKISKRKPIVHFGILLVVLPPCLCNTPSVSLVLKPWLVEDRVDRFHLLLRTVFWRLQCNLHNIRIVLFL